MGIGQGYDVHKMVEGRKLIIGGVEIPYYKGLLGHSDADVLTHAIMDALLGACGFNDIGSHFPDNDDRFKGIDSLELLNHVRNLLYDSGFKVINIDSTIIAQKPKMAPYIERMKINISNVLGISLDDINIKATTEEGMGFTGREEGIASQAVCLIEKRNCAYNN